MNVIAPIYMIGAIATFVVEQRRNVRAGVYDPSIEAFFVAFIWFVAVPVMAIAALARYTERRLSK